MLSKQKPGTFNGVASDMKLEETIQRLRKWQSSITVQTRKKTITEWGLVYHEELTISNVYHEMGGSISVLVNDKVNKFTACIKERGNPLLVSSVTKLHRFPTGQIINEENASRILHIIQSGQIKYIQFPEERIITEEKNFLKLSK